MPDKMAIHLPSSLTVKMIYERMREERTSDSMISQPQFYNLWKEFYPHVVIPPVINTLALYYAILLYVMHNVGE